MKIVLGYLSERGFFMKIGKLDWDDLKYIIEGNRSVNRTDVKVKSGIGEDCSVIDYGDFECVLSTDPITGAQKNIGKLAVNINCNDIASSGAEPVGILVTILAPEKTEIEDIYKVMKEIDDETKKLNVEILGGHTEVTNAVNKMIVSCTVVGKSKNGKAISTAGAKDGDDVILTKYLCLEGTSIIVNEYKEKSMEVLLESEVEEAKGYIKSLSVVQEGIIAGNFGVNSMHDVTEGGVLGALWEVAKASNKGFKVYKDKMPLTNLTIKLCNHLGIDPLKLISSGSMMIITPNGDELIKILQKNGIKGTIVGKITEEKGILISEGEQIEVLPPERDELYKLNI